MKWKLAEFSTTVTFHDNEKALFEGVGPSWILISDKTVLERLPKLLPRFAKSIEAVPQLDKSSDVRSMSFTHSPEPKAALKTRAGAGIFAKEDSPPMAVLSLPSGEAAKTMEGLESILRVAFSCGLSRESTFVVLGGGAVSDVAAFAASVFMRGCMLVIIPSTVLSMVDAAFGGKTAINYFSYKNMVGSMYPASRVGVFIPILRTLPEREYRSGLAEVIKSAMIGDAVLLSFLETRHADIMARNEDCLKEIIQRSLVVKADIVSEDFRDGGIRAHLNLGHTFAHALESVSGLGSITHGEAVIWGILRALRLGEELGKTNPAYRQRIEHLLQLYEYDLGFAADHEVDDIVKAMQMDKKKKAGTLFFVLQSEVCQTFLSEVDEKTLRAVLSE